MSNRPQPPVPGSADDSIVVIVKKSNHSGTSALLIAVLLVLAAVWVLRGGQSKAAVPSSTEATRPSLPEKGARVKAEAPAKTPDIIPASSGISSPIPASSGRATFFEPTEDEEPGPAAP